MSASEDPGELSERRRERIERWRPRMLAVWTVVGVFIASWLIIGALGFVQQALGLILVGGVAGFMCSPVTNRLEDHKVPRGASRAFAQHPCVHRASAKGPRRVLEHLR